MKASYKETPLWERCWSLPRWFKVEDSTDSRIVVHQAISYRNRKSIIKLQQRNMAWNRVKFVETRRQNDYAFIDYLRPRLLVRSLTCLKFHDRPINTKKESSSYTTATKTTTTTTTTTATSTPVFLWKKNQERFNTHVFFGKRSRWIPFRSNLPGCCIPIGDFLRTIEV